MGSVRAETWVCLFFASLIVGKTGYLVLQAHPPAHLEIEALNFIGDAKPPLSINHATAQQLAALPGIGVVLAERILSYRRVHGRIDSLAHLQEVEGIGPHKAAMLMRQLTY